MLKNIKNYTYFFPLLLLVLLGESIFNGFLQVGDIWKNSTYDYALLRGNTGPLVYPGGFIWTYIPLYLLSDEGENIVVVQWIFVLLYALTLGVVWSIYKETKIIPLWALLLLSLSKRIHSIFVLRLFNDCFAVFVFYLSLLAFIKNRWTIGVILYSFAVGIKMNILLYSPALGLLLLQRFGFSGTILKLILCAIVQVVISIPFSTTNFLSYIGRAFNLGRIFIYFWYLFIFWRYNLLSVNWKFIPEEVFLSPMWGVFLLIVTVTFWLLFASKHWTKQYGGIWNAVKVTVFRDVVYKKDKNLSPLSITRTMMMCNFIGIVFARSLHYQFYVWYFHTLPFLLWSVSISTILRLVIFFLIEICWNVYPSNAHSSALLFGCHMYLLYSLYYNLNEDEDSSDNKTNKMNEDKDNSHVIGADNGKTTRRRRKSWLIE